MTAAKKKVKKLPLPRPSAEDLLRWYARHRRDLPWRAKPGKRANPYRVWLSEIMLQQTTTATVTGYYGAFLRRWPKIEDLAAAPRDEILAAWAGLGYYRRARLLHDCAKIIVAEHDGKFPPGEADLLRLPGIGRYTAAAIAAIAFERRANVIDGNVSRVISRLYAIRKPLSSSTAQIRRLAEAIVPPSRYGDYAQALMDLGATLCTPRRPQCPVCPWQESCRAAQTGNPARYPIAGAKTAKPVRRAIAFWLTDRTGRVWVRKRAETGLLPGMTEIPSSPWIEQLMPELSAVKDSAPAQARWRILPGEIRHNFTHFDLYIKVASASVSSPMDGNGSWSRQSDLQKLALPTVMRKIIALAAK